MYFKNIDIYVSLFNQVFWAVYVTELISSSLD